MVHPCCFLEVRALSGECYAVEETKSLGAFEKSNSPPSAQLLTGGPQHQHCSSVVPPASITKEQARHSQTEPGLGRFMPALF